AAQQACDEVLISLAAAWGDLDDHFARQTTKALVRQIIALQARDGVKIGGTARRGVKVPGLAGDARTGEGRINGRWKPEQVDLFSAGGRLRFVADGHAIPYEQTYTIPMRTSRTSNMLGTDQLPASTASMRLFGIAVGGAQSVTDVGSEPYLTGTRWDR